MLSPVISALNGHLIGLNLGLPIAWENTLPPDLTGPWLSAFFVPSETNGSTLGDTGTDETTGFMQVDINTETGNGWSELHSYADRVQEHYRLGLRLTFSGQDVQITGSSRSGARVENGWYRLSLSLYWLAYTRRN